MRPHHSATQRVNRYRKRQASRGIRRVELRVPEGDVAAVKGWASALLAGERPRFLDDEAVLSVMRDCLVAQLRPEALLLIGSRAAGEARPDSDFDFVVVHRGAEGDLSYEAAARPLLGLGVAADVIPVALEDFLRESRDRTSLVWEGRPARLLYVRKGSALDGAARAA